MAVTVDSFLDEVKRLITVPANQALMNDDALLLMGDEASQSYVVPLLLSLRQEYFVTSVTQAVTSGVSSYSIPTRSIARTLRELKYVELGDRKNNLAQIAIEDTQLWANGTGVVTGYHFKGDKIVLVDVPNVTTASLEIWYYLQPSKLVKLSEAARVVSVAGDVVTVTSVPATFAANVVADFVEGVSGNSILGMDASITSVAGTQVTFGAGVVPLTLVAGDYIALAGQTPVVQIPVEATPYLATKTCVRILNSIGDFEGMAKLEELASQQEKTLKIITEPRNTGENAKVNPRWGLLRQGRATFRRGFWGA
jgi:hypothetical protein